MIYVYWAILLVFQNAAFTMVGHYEDDAKAKLEVVD